MPQAYLRAHPELRLFSLPIFGWPQHGRSTYLSALAYLLTRLSSVWPGYSCWEANGATRGFLTTINEQALCGLLPPAGKKRENLLLLLEDMNRWRTLALAFEDLPGKHFERYEVSSECVVRLRWSPFALMVLSLADLYGPKNWGTVDMLFNSYLQALSDVPSDPSAHRRGLVVVLTKADLLQNQIRADLLQYLRNDKLSGCLRPRRSSLAKEQAAPRVYDKALSDYLDKMRAHETALSSWLAQDPHFRNLQTKARRHQIELRFSIVSALGEQVREGNRLPVSWNPKRVLDPLFWLLELEREHGGIGEFPSRAEAESGTREASLYLIARHLGWQDDTKRLRAQFKNQSGTFAPLDEELAHVLYELQDGRIYLQLSEQARLSVRRANEGWRLVMGMNHVYLEPGEECRIDDWEIEVATEPQATAALLDQV